MSNNVDNLARAPQPEAWQLDKKVSVGVILSLIIHTFAVIWFLASMNSGIESLQNGYQKLESRVSALNTKFDNMFTKDEVLRLHDYSMDRIGNLDDRVRDLEKEMFRRDDK